ncbi:glycoside hydrolase family 127 protein [Cytophagaceae bacterium YF14B1]|uniref:Glycoside hydrolase family 127 protein n=1 Tax=Xanthocytophaga flava TaxID=3048013 RepID=A0AAE3QT28_9BACT|nr:glycoside hydrolase family 127 protein [Xanthocytophaga flavus]MDJ1484875.1 glycoside hydrolase family 127 protein [Xanthocytophaga flavus]
MSGYSQTKDREYPIQPIPFTSVKVNDKFWAPRIKKNHEVTIPIALGHCYKTGRVDNFLFAAHTKEGKFCTEYPFDDTDIYKIIEGASYSLQTFPDKYLEARLDTLIDYIGKAQEPDGYLYTARTIDPAHPHPWAGMQRWVKESDLSHELYNSGHLFEAAVAHYQATGKRSLLDIAIKNADLLCRDFGPGKLDYEPGHQIVEMALVKLYRTTGRKQYLDLAKFFLDSRGKGTEYSQDNKKVVDQTEAVGHAVRATYMYSGMADVAAITGDEAYVHAIDKIWEDVVYDKLYITGGIGAAGGHEGFGPAYDLPNMAAYNETCASIGNVYWNYRLFLLHGDAKYYDVLERTLYNGLVSGVSVSGDRFFYDNPLQSLGQHSRKAWFGCACCPSNVCRFIPSLPGYMYAKNATRIYTNLYVNSTATIDFKGSKVEVSQKTDYPWDGKINFVVNPAKSQNFEMALRIPGWAQNEPSPGNLYSFATKDNTAFTVNINGKPATYQMDHGYAVIKRQWKKGDEISLVLPMPVRKVVANAKVEADHNKVALQRGPVVYCAEWPDYTNSGVLNLVLDKNASLTPDYKAELLGGVEVLEGSASQARRSTNNKVDLSAVPFKAIPYYAWANRGSGEMAVWLATELDAARPSPAPTIASTSTITASHTTKTLLAINDQAEPKNSNDRDNLNYHWWPLKDTTQWIQYTFAKPEKVSSVKLYWFDDSPWGGCRVPESWKLLYLAADGKWKEVQNQNSYGVEKDKYNKVAFSPVQTGALKIEVKLPKEYAGGILEWSVE